MTKQRAAWWEDCAAPSTHNLPTIIEPRCNIELKARPRDPARSLEVCETLGAEDRGVLVQRDTYFEVPRGRLKLREELDGTPHLISYTRPDEPAGRESHYRIVKVPQAEELIAALSATLGIRVVVSKRRRLFIWQSVRIHLDEVEGLGSFVEFEAVATPGSDLSVEIKRVEYLRDRFELEDADLIGTGYADLLLASR